MPPNVDTTKIGRRSNRLGSGPRKAFRGRHSSRGVLPLNQGSSPHGSKNVLKLGGKGGSFGSGRPAGGGGGGLTAALAGLPPQAEGPPPVVGPPPVDFPILPPEQPFRTTPIFPSLPSSPFDDRTTPLYEKAALFPRPLEPEVDPDLVWQLGQRRAF